MGKRKYNSDDYDFSNSNTIKKVKTELIDWKPFQNYIQPVNIENYNDIIPISDIDIINYPKIWVAPTHLKNYFLNDTILDWFKVLDTQNTNHKSYILLKSHIKGNKKLRTEVATTTNFLFTKGNDFELEIWKYLSSKYPNDTIQIAENAYNITTEDLNKTISSIQQGIPIIYQAPLQDNISFLRGSCDLIIRSDWLPKLFEETPLDITRNLQTSNNNCKWDYRIIDIKWMQLKLKKDGRTPLSFPLLPVYRAQLGIYNYLLGKIQGYTPNYTYILGKGISISNQKNQYNYHNSWNRLAVLSYDNEFISNMINGIQWNRSVKTFGKTWNIEKPNKYLYPNMSNKYDNPYNNRKKEIARQIGELTQIWNVGFTQRRHAHSLGIYSWKDAQCNSANLGIKSAKIGDLVNKILNINQTYLLAKNKKPVFLLPEFQLSNTSNLSKSNETSNFNKKRKSNLEEFTHSTKIKKITSSSQNHIFYLDFETVSTCFLDYNYNSNSNNPVLLFMIGLGDTNNNELNWNYKCWTITKNDTELEFLMVEKVLSYISNSHNPIVFHWSPAELSVIKNINTRHKNKLNKYLKKIMFVDLFQFFYDNQIVIPGALTFGLKDIATSLYNLGIIKTNWVSSSNLLNGLDAMMSAVPIFAKEPKLNKQQKNEIMKEITNYNEIDCKVLMEIKKWLDNTSNLPAYKLKSICNF
jgi:predicted RecB family nuclease